MAELAVVTGASSGIGQAYAERLAQDGWDLVVVARRGDRLDELATRLSAECGVAVRAIAADLGKADQVHALCEDLADTEVGMLINNAALAHYMPFAELPAERAEELVELNVLAPVLLSRAVIPGMLERKTGAVINIASLLAFSGSTDLPFFPKRAVYAASKAFLVTFSEVLASEVADRGVRVQVVCPGVVKSEFHTRQGMDLAAMERMEPQAVVQASLHDLERDVVVCIPGLVDQAGHEQLEAAQRQLLGSSRVSELPDRYNSS